MYGEKVSDRCHFLRISIKIILCSLLLGALTGCSTTEFLAKDDAGDRAENCFTTGWPSDRSSLIPDTSLLRGRLPNGFRYVIKQNKYPKDRVALYLDVQAGSLNEKDKQRGLAHFLEHMVFNGSTHFPPGSLVDYFQSIGMNFGGDTNAHTSHQATVYNIFLPNGSVQDLDAGFLVLADYAGGALLRPVEINRERGVILAEKRARDSAGYRSQVAGSAFAFQGTLYPERMVIGVQKTLEEAGQKELKSFYDVWYRPDNMILVVVGDMDPKQTEGLIEKRFASLAAKGGKPPCPDFGNIDHQALETFYHHEPELGKTKVSIETVWDLPFENDSPQVERLELLRTMSSVIIDNRLQRLQEEAGVKLVRAGYYVGDIVNRIGYGILSAQVDAEHWRESLTTLTAFLQTALLQGFTDDEVERSKKEISAQLDNSVLTVDSEDSRHVAGRIIDHLNSNRVYQSAKQEQLFYQKLIKGIDTAEVNTAFRDIWKKHSRLVSVTGDAHLPNDAKTLIASAYQEAIQRSPAARVTEQKSVFPYLAALPVSSAEPRQEHFSAIGVERLIFDNGLIVNLKKNNFTDNRIRVRANFGAGKPSEFAPGVAMLAEEVINGSGSGKLPQSAIDEVLEGSSIQLSFMAGEEAFAWKGTTLNTDFELFCQLLQTMLVDPGFRKSVFSKEKQRLELMYQRVDRQIEGAFPLHITPFLADFAEGFGLPAWKDIAALDFDAVAQWVNTQLRPTDLEISLAGDFDRGKVVALLTKYFSAMKLSTGSRTIAQKVVFPAGKKMTVRVESSVDKSMIAVAWPTDDFWDIHRTRRLNLLADVMANRLRKSIREKLAASYSPNVSSFSSRSHPGFGYILARMLVKPGSEEMVIKEILRISNQLKTAGISNGELLRVKEPQLTSLHELVRTNRYWLQSVLSLSSLHPIQLVWPKTLIADYSTIGKSEIDQLAAKYLDNGQAAIAKAIPRISRQQTK